MARGIAIGITNLFNIFVAVLVIEFAIELSDLMMKKYSFGPIPNLLLKYMIVFFVSATLLAFIWKVIIKKYKKQIEEHWLICLILLFIAVLILLLS